MTVWGLLTETLDGPVFRHAVDTLGMVRELDLTRLVILNSGRFDAQPAIGSVSNPGGTEWEHTWGHESPGAPGRTLVPDPATGWLTMASWINGDLSLAGSIEGNGDTHTYPIVPHTPSAIAFLRGLGRGTKPHMLSEYGIGSVMNVIGESRDYEQAGARDDLLDAALVRSMAVRFEADWARYGLDDVYPFPEDMLLEAQRLHGRQRALGFDIVRSNPQIPAFNVTGLLDHALTGEGFWTFWRRWKPGIVDVLTDGWAPLRWSLFSEPRHAYTGGELRLEAVLANEDALAPGRYPARFRLHGPAGIAWQAEQDVVIPEAAGPGPLAVPVMDVRITAPTTPGRYTFAAELRSGGRPNGGRLSVEVSDDPAMLRHALHVSGWGLDKRVTSWLTAHGVSVGELGASAAGAPGIIVVGDVPATESTLDRWQALARQVAEGGVAIFLSPAAFQRDDDPLGWLPLAQTGTCDEFYDWVYHREWVSGRRQLFDGLPGPGVMDWDIYGPLLSRRMFEGLPDSDDVAAVAFAVGYSRVGGYASGIVAGSYPLGAGRFAINAFDILGQLGRHPAADRMLLNLLSWAATRAGPGVGDETRGCAAHAYRLPMSDAWVDIHQSSSQIPSFAYRSGLAVFEEALVDGQLVARSWNASGFLSAWDSVRMDTTAHAMPQSFGLEHRRPVSGVPLGLRRNRATRRRGCRRRGHPASPSGPTHLGRRPHPVGWHGRADALAGDHQPGAQPAALGTVSTWSGVLQLTNHCGAHLTERPCSVGYIAGHRMGPRGQLPVV